MQVLFVVIVTARDMQVGRILLLIHTWWAASSADSLDDYLKSHNDVLLPGQRLLTQGFSSRRIPKQLFVSRRSASLDVDEVDNKTLSMYSREEARGWKIRIVDYAASDRWMASTFPNTSLLWAYSVLNIGSAKADLWRLSQLFIEGGVYADYDAFIVSPFDDLIQRENASLILSTERGSKRNVECYVDSFHSSKVALQARFGQQQYAALVQAVGSSVVSNWFIFSVQGHPVLLSLLESAVELIRAEFARRSVINHGSYGESDAFRNSLRFRQVLCTTGPNMLSQALFEALLRANFTTMQAAKEAGFLSLVQADFKPYGGVAKLPTYFTKLDPSFYVFGMRNLSMRLLQRYAPLPHKQLQGHCLTSLDRKVFWLFSEGARRPFRDWDQFRSQGLSPRQHCTALHPLDLEQMREGAVLPSGFNFSASHLLREAFSPRHAGF